MKSNINKAIGKIVHCETEEQINELLSKLDKIGYTNCYDSYVKFQDLLESEPQQETPTKIFQYYIAFETKKGKGACFTDSNLGLVDTKFLLGLIKELEEQLGDTPIITNLIPLGEKKQVI